MRLLKYVILIYSVIFLTCAGKEEKFLGERGGVMMVGMREAPAAIDPLAPSMFSSNDLLELLFLRLHRIDPGTGRMKPILAESWEFSEDLKSITYYLRKNIKWWDGQPVTADDIYYTYMKMKDPATNYPNINALRFIRDAVVIGPYAIRFDCEKVYADILTDTDIMPVPEHVYEEKGSAFGTNPVGNGPYKIKEWLPGNGMILVANEDYYRMRPPLDEVHIRFYANGEEMLANFAAGDLDLITDIDPHAGRSLSSNENVSVHSRPGNSYLYIAWNMEHPFLGETEVRNALGMAINRQRLLDELYLGMGTISTGPLTPSSWAYDDSIMPVEYDSEKARAILESAGFTDFNRNRIIDKDRMDFVIRIITNEENADRVAIMRYIAEDLRRIGVRVITEAFSTDAFIDAIVKGEFDGFIMGWNVGEKIDPAVFWSSQGRYNLVSYENPVIDSLIDIGVSMLDRKKAEEVWHAFQRIIHDDQPYSFLIVPDKIAASYKRLRGVDNGVRLASAQDFWIPEAERRVSIASVLPEPIIREHRVAPPEAVPASTETTLITGEEAGGVTAPEMILEAAAQSDTTVIDTASTVAVAVPPAPPKPSVITRAEPTTRVEPKYPASALEFAASGKIVVRVLVGEDGLVKEAKIISSFGNPACEQAALDAARQWEFVPAKKDGVPFEQMVSIPFTFTP
jgi:peptide/nickel transport system substrate-binding protein